MDFDVPSTTQGQLKTIKLCQILIHFSELCSDVKPYSSQICNDQSKCEEQRRVYPFYIALVKNNNNIYIYINIKRSHPTEKARGQDRQNKTERARQKEQDKKRKRQDRKNKTERARGQDKKNKTERAR